MRQKEKQRGFSLIELLIVIVILGLLAGILVPRMMGTPDKARVTTTAVTIEGLKSALKMYKLDNDVYPTTEQGLAALKEKPASRPVPKNYPEGGYLEKGEILDAWGNEFIYRAPGESGRSFEIISLGADGEEGGEGYAADITSY